MALAVLCDIVGRYGGTERYWETVLPALARTTDIRLLARVVEERERFGVPATAVPWSDENAQPSEEAARQVADSLRGCATVITSNVFDAAVLHAVRAQAQRWVARIHDYRPFCPNGNKVFPQFPSVCTVPMGGPCVANAFLRGCVLGPRVESMRRIRRRVRLRDEIAKADAVLVSSAYVRGTCIQNGLDPSRVFITPPPLPDGAFADTSPAGQGVLFFGRYNDQKGLASLIRAIGTIAADVRPKLVVAGAGDQREEHRGKDLAARLGVTVDWLGWLPAQAVRDEIDRARVVALPSLWPEPFGLTGIEAQARGRPVAAYDVGGVRDWLDGGGMAVPRGDEGALGAAIQVLITDYEIWTQQAKSARESAERFRLARHLQVMQSLVSIDPAQGGGR
ncbi:MAG TPA: glycosyltransferase [Candidatus Baltobacteraceae bacterium]|jgi:glycosyltransferase involved in cell wall biosynthesis|nr:glycosyltransferase [Candidatus Baltobacteraceae bacterium]